MSGVRIPLRPLRSAVVLVVGAGARGMLAARTVEVVGRKSGSEGAVCCVHYRTVDGERYGRLVRTARERTKIGVRALSGARLRAVGIVERMQSACSAIEATNIAAIARYLLGSGLSMRRHPARVHPEPSAGFGGTDV